MEDQFDKAVRAMKERTQQKQEQEQNAAEARRSTDAELLARWCNTKEKFVQPNLEKLKAALVEAGYSDVSIDSGVPTPSGFVARISGKNPDDGHTRRVSLNYTTAPELRGDMAWQRLHIQYNGQLVRGTFGPELDEKNFKTHVWSLFF